MADIYLSFLVYTESEVKYVKGDNVTDPGFAVLNRFGPWRIDEDGEMRSFLMIANALVVRPFHVPQR